MKSSIIHTLLRHTGQIQIGANFVSGRVIRRSLQSKTRRPYVRIRRHLISHLRLLFWRFLFGFLKKNLLPCEFLWCSKSRHVEYVLDAGIPQSELRLAGEWTFRGSKPGVDDVFHTRPGCPRGPSSRLCNAKGVSFPRVKQPGRGVDHPLASSAEV